jgi:Zn-dependent protease with chaperone function
VSAKQLPNEEFFMNRAKLRHPLEWPAYILAVVLIPLDVAFGYWWDGGYILFGLGLLAVGLVFFREVERRISHGNSVALSRRQFPEIYDIVDDFARKLELKRIPDVYVTTGDGVLNAFSTESFGKSYIVLNSELFANQGESIRKGLAFIIGHELGHLKLKHTSIFYTIPLLPWEWLSMIPLFGYFLGFPYNVLNRFREYSCDRIGAHLAPTGVNGLLLLAAGRYVYEQVDLDTFLEQAWSRETRGLWTGIAELFSTHPFIANRVRTLYNLGFFGNPHIDAPQMNAGAREGDGIGWAPAS